MLLRCSWAGIGGFLFVLTLTTCVYAQPPKGQFLCRQQTGGPPEGAYYYTNVANMYLNSDGSFSAKDLTTSIPEVHGHFTYDKKAKAIEWDSGIWKTLLGHYTSSPGPVFIVTTKKDPQGKVDGTFQCVRVSK